MDSPQEEYGLEGSLERQQRESMASGGLNFPGIRGHGAREISLGDDGAEGDGEVEAGELRLPVRIVPLSVVDRFRHPCTALTPSFPLLIVLFSATRPRPPTPSRPSTTASPLSTRSTTISLASSRLPRWNSSTRRASTRGSRSTTRTVLRTCETRSPGRGGRRRSSEAKKEAT